MTPRAAFRSTLELIAQGQHVSLTTFRKDGRAVATPLWFVREGGQLIVMTAPDSGKVKRLRKNSHVVIAPCDSRGRITDGAPSAEATARLMDTTETARAHKLMVRKHLLVRLADWWDRVRRRRRPWIGIAVTDN
ncbi:PPOX class F420-dependent oxidoreductase [Streptomyces sp. NPDC057137]|uniref:PPOX class F420-dependent oxidoreductase n=1 Tax=Streptomyces sp. NPDC057137 TaxID=3346030 RepID=UPI00363319EA